jgi:hypothetical protein
MAFVGSATALVVLSGLVGGFGPVAGVTVTVVVAPPATVIVVSGAVFLALFAVRFAYQPKLVSE